MPSGSSESWLACFGEAVCLTKHLSSLRLFTLKRGTQTEMGLQAQEAMALDITAHIKIPKEHGLSSKSLSKVMVLSGLLARNGVVIRERQIERWGDGFNNGNGEGDGFGEGYLVGNGEEYFRERTWSQAC